MTRDDGSSCTNEMVLFHGTTASAVEDIVRNGFNRSYCRDNTVYGRGVYFAKSAALAADEKYSPPEDGTANRYRCFRHFPPRL
jgi:hypothetical protein